MTPFPAVVPYPAERAGHHSVLYEAPCPGFQACSVLFPVYSKTISKLLYTFLLLLVSEYTRSFTVPASAKMNTFQVLALLTEMVTLYSYQISVLWHELDEHLLQWAVYSILYRFSGKLPNKVETDKIYLGNQELPILISKKD